MNREFNPNLPIYIQVMEEIKKEIINGHLTAGSKIDSVRQLALSYGVNPNTIQKALSELERTGIIYSKRAQGRYVSEDIALINQMKKDIYQQKVKQFVEQMQELGIDAKTLIAMIEELIEL